MKSIAKRCGLENDEKRIIQSRVSRLESLDSRIDIRKVKNESLSNAPMVTESCLTPEPRLANFRRNVFGRIDAVTTRTRMQAVGSLAGHHVRVHCLPMTAVNPYPTSIA